MVSSENVVYVYENHEKSDELGLDELWSLIIIEVNF